jgi:hypothetical protein
MFFFFFEKEWSGNGDNVRRLSLSGQSPKQKVQMIEIIDLLKLPENREGTRLEMSSVS